MALTTPTTKITLNGVPVFIKREDMYVAPVPRHQGHDVPPPPFAKPRGLVPRLERLKGEGVVNVAYMDSAVSMSGWAVAYYAPPLGLHPIILWPGYKDGNRLNMEKHIKLCVQLGAEVLYLENPTQQSVNWYRARRFIQERYQSAQILPQGLPFKEAILSVAKEVENVPRAAWGGTVVLSVGGGTNAAGVVTGMMAQGYNQRVVGVLVSPKSQAKMHAMVRDKAQGMLKGAWCARNLTIVDAGWQYHATPTVTAPFPCNPYYDLKAWAWLLDNLKHLVQPVLFWNIGG